METLAKTRPFDLEGWHLAYMVYQATGEGTRVCISVAGTASRAKTLLEGRLDKFFHPFVESSPIGLDVVTGGLDIAQWLPLAVRHTLETIPLGCGEYYGELYYNVA